MESGGQRGQAGALRTSPFRIGAYLIEPLRNRVAGPGGESSLQPKVIDLLCLLAERPGEVVSRSELIDRIWGVEFGGDESLTRAVSLLRKVFDDTRGAPNMIETIAKRGYRLVAPVEPAEPVAAPAGTNGRRRRRFAIAALAAIILAAAAFLWWRSESTIAPGRSERTGILVTVGPFNSDPALAAGGFAEELSAEIARSPDVIARPQGAGTAPPPGALEYRLRGDIRRVGDGVRVDVQLLDAANGSVVWSAEYDRRFDSQFSARSGIVHAIDSDILYPLLGAAKARLVARPAATLEPWQAILLVTWVPGSEVRPSGPPVEDSYWLQRHALQRDPDFAPAHALYAELASYHALFHPPWDTPWRLERARRHAERAIELAPYDAAILYQIALYDRFIGDRDRAIARLKRVLQLEPDHPLARIDLDFVRGQCTAEAGDSIRRIEADAGRLSADNPARWVALAHLSALRLGIGDFAGARDSALRSRQIVPITWTAMTLAAADVALGREREAAEVLAEHRREWPNMDLRYFAERTVPRWCLGGPRTGEVQTVFRRLAARMAASRE